MSTMNDLCCIVDCPTNLSDIVKQNYLLPFPEKCSPQRKVWMDACKSYESHIKQISEPKICLRHFYSQHRFKSSTSPNTIDLAISLAEFHRTVVPSLCLTTADIESFNRETLALNQLVAEWISLNRPNNPNMVVKISGDTIKAKAREVASIMKISLVDIDFEWLENFLVYLRKNDIQISNIGDKSLEKKKFHKKNTETTEVTKHYTSVNQNPEDSNILNSNQSTQKTCTKSKNFPEVLDSEISIQTYREALEAANILENYVKNTQNEEALQLIRHVKNIIECNLT